MLRSVSRVADVTVVLLVMMLLLLHALRLVALVAVSALQMRLLLVHFHRQLTARILHATVARGVSERVRNIVERKYNRRYGVVRGTRDVDERYRHVCTHVVVDCWVVVGVVVELVRDNRTVGSTSASWHRDWGFEGIVGHGRHFFALRWCFKRPVVRIITVTIIVIVAFAFGLERFYFRYAYHRRCGVADLLLLLFRDLVLHDDGNSALFERQSRLRFAGVERLQQPLQ